MKLEVEAVRKIIVDLYHATGADHFFDQPLIGVASAEDELFADFKRVVGSYHWTPKEALALEHPGEDAKSVIVWVLPVNESARKANRNMKDRPSREWAGNRSFGELANDQMRLQAVKVLGAYGYPSSAPHLLQKRRSFDMAALGYSSHWSERHAAFTAGLGTFGLSAGLITESGIAIRLGTIVTTLSLRANKRTYGNDPYSWCTMCGECVERCPVAAVGPIPGDRDKGKCAQHLKDIEKNRHETYGWIDYELGCGLCQTGVPCEHKRP